MLAAIFVSCDKEQLNVEPGPVETTFSLVDSIKVDSRFQQSDPEFYNRLNGRIYKRNSTNKMEALFTEKDNEVTLYFVDRSDGIADTWFTLTFKNSMISQFPSVSSLKVGDNICLKDYQDFPDGASSLAVACNTVMDGTLMLQYDKATDVISGSISNLKHRISYYVPHNFFPGFESGVMYNSGSNRNINLTFKNIRRAKP
jgi:hypothetical protein